MWSCCWWISVCFPANGLIIPDPPYTCKVKTSLAHSDTSLQYLALFPAVSLDHCRWNTPLESLCLYQAYMMLGVCGMTRRFTCTRLLIRKSTGRAIASTQDFWKACTLHQIMQSMKLNRKFSSFAEMMAQSHKFCRERFYIAIVNYICWVIPENFFRGTTFAGCLLTVGSGKSNFVHGFKSWSNNHKSDEVNVGIVWNSCTWFSSHRHC